MLSKLLKRQPAPAPTYEVGTAPTEVKASSESFSSLVLLSLVSRVSGVAIEKLQHMNEEELVDFITLGYWPTEQHLSIRKSHNARQVKND